MLVEKPGMSFEHNDAQVEIVRQLLPQLDRNQFRIRFNSARVRRSRSCFIPDVLVVPLEANRVRATGAGSLETYADPAALVVECRSPLTGRYDIDAKLPEYMARGDREIWRVHPYARKLTAWRRREDGSYAEVVYLGGIVPVESLPGVTIDPDAVFAP